MKNMLMILMGGLALIAVVSYLPSCNKQATLNEVTLDTQQQEEKNLETIKEIIDQHNQLDDAAIYDQLYAEDCDDCESSVGETGVPSDQDFEERPTERKNSAADQPPQSSVQVPQPVTVDDSQYTEYPPIDLDAAFEALFMRADLPQTNDYIDDPCFGIPDCSIE